MSGESTNVGIVRSLMCSMEYLESQSLAGQGKSSRNHVCTTLKIAEIKFERVLKQVENFHHGQRVSPRRISISSATLARCPGCLAANRGLPAQLHSASGRQHVFEKIREGESEEILQHERINMEEYECEDKANAKIKSNELPSLHIGERSP
jgi:hypothetical protein